MRFSIFITGGSNLIGLMYGDVVMLFGVRFGCCGGKVSREGRLSETITGIRMRGSGKEVKDSRTREKMILRAF